MFYLGDNPEAAMIEREDAAFSLVNFLEDRGRLQTLIQGLGPDQYDLKIFLLKILNLQQAREILIEMLGREELSDELRAIFTKMSGKMSSGDEIKEKAANGPDYQAKIIPLFNANNNH